MDRKIYSAIELLLIIVFFILSSYIVQSNLIGIDDLIRRNNFGMFIFVFILIVAVVIAPVSAVPIIPIASNLWGWLITGILSVIGWTLGAVAAFVIARKYGVPLVKKFVHLEKIAKFERLIPKENIFWSIVFLRMSIPVDILSYAIGLFSHIKLRQYLIATIIGVTPFAFIFAYTATLPIFYQIIAFIITAIIIFIGYKKIR